MSDVKKFSVNTINRDIYSYGLSLIDSDEFLYAIGDSENNVLFGIRLDGSVYQPKGIPEQTREKLSEINSRFSNLEEKSLEFMSSDDYLFAITDCSDNVLFGIDYKGGSFVNSISGVCTVENFDSKDYLFVVMDSADNLLFGIKNDGTFVTSKFELPADLLKGLKNYTDVDTNDNEFIYKITDNNGLILFGVRWNGSSYIPKGIPEEQKSINRKVEKKLSDLEIKLANFKGGTGDWSEAGEMRIPIPRCGIVNIHSNIMPTAKSGLGTSGVNCDIPCQWEFWDQQGNYTNIWVKMSAQGNSSLAFIKKNISVDMFTDNTFDKEYIIKFGDWVPQDSFHLKAYYTDAFRGIGVCSYMLWEKMMKMRPINDNVPYKSMFTDKYKSVADDIMPDLKKNFDTGAKCHPMGFPVIVYQNGEFYGIYSWQLKKHRDNYFMNKKTVEHIHLDGSLTSSTIWNNNINWIYFEVRNPKNLICADGSKYDGDNPKELISVNSELYDDSNKDMKNTAKVKDYIIKLSKYLSELKSAENSGKSSEEMRELLNEYYNISFFIDYIIHAQVINNSDGFNKNWQWTTWDGKRWTVNPYDLDMSFGGYHMGVMTTQVPTGWVGNEMNTPVGWVIKYFLDDIKERYSEFRSKGLFNPEYIAKLVNNWCMRIGEDMFEREYEKWYESPCNRNSNINKEYWKRISDYTAFPTWSENNTYNINSLVYWDNKKWISLTNSNKNNIPEDYSVFWKEIGYNSEKVYNIGDVCYHGKYANSYKFECIQDNVNLPPFNSFYIYYPYELGYYDSSYRVLKWIEERITYVDELMDYKK